MSQGTEYANKLEGWFSSLPGPIQSVLHEPFDWMNDKLEAVAGDPDDLMRVSSVYVQVGQQVHELVQEQVSQRKMLDGGVWTGDSYDAFTAKMGEIETSLNKLGDATGKTEEILKAGAQACVDGANMIIDIVVSLLSFALSTLAVNLALSVLSFGASMAAWVAEMIAKGLQSMAQVLNAIQKVAQILLKIAEIIKKLATILKQIAELLKAIKEVLQAIKAAAGATKLMSVGGLAARGGAAGAYALTSHGISAATGGAITIPGGAGTGLHAAQDGHDLYGDVQDAQDVDH